MSLTLSPVTRHVPVISRRWTEALILAAALLATTAYTLALRLNPDVAWLYVIAAKCLGGAVLYRDIVAVNAPFASISLMPAVLLQHATALPVPAAVTIYVSLLGLLSTLACFWLIGRYKTPPISRAAMKACVFAAIFLLPGIEFGEREHLFCILALPAMLAVPLRNADARLGRLASFALGFAAAMACNLKPPFAAVILAVEISGLAMFGIKSLFTAATAGLLAAAALSALAYAFLFPLYVTAIMPWMIALYSAYNDTATTVREALLWGGTALAMFLLWRTQRGSELSALRHVLLAVAAAGLLVFLLQDKGWDYQAFIVAFCASILAGMALHASLRRPAASWAAGLVIAVLLARGFAQFQAPDYVDYHFPHVKRLVATSPGSFLILTTAGTPAGRHIIETGHDWASRFPCLEMLPGIVSAASAGRTSRWEAPFRAAMAEDLGHFAPPLIFVQRDDLPGLPKNFDLLAWLMRDPRFASQWAHYHADGGADGHFAVFRRT
jgi:hypothetical protein